MYSAQDRYQLPSPGSCSEDGSIECEQWVLHISDHTSLEAEPERPEVTDLCTFTGHCLLLFSFPCGVILCLPRFVTMDWILDDELLL